MASKFIPLSHTFFESELFGIETSSPLVLYLYCIKRANYSKNGQFDKGEFAEEYETMANRLGCSTRAISRHMGYLIQHGFIERINKCKYKVVGYDKLTDMSSSASPKGSPKASPSIENNIEEDDDEEGWIQF